MRNDAAGSVVTVSLFSRSVDVSMKKSVFGAVSVSVFFKQMLPARYIPCFQLICVARDKTLHHTDTPCVTAKKYE